MKTKENNEMVKRYARSLLQEDISNNNNSDISIAITTLGDLVNLYFKNENDRAVYSDRAFNILCIKKLSNHTLSQNIYLKYLEITQGDIAMTLGELPDDTNTEKF